MAGYTQLCSHLDSGYGWKHRKPVWDCYNINSPHGRLIPNACFVSVWEIPGSLARVTQIELLYSICSLACSHMDLGGQVSWRGALILTTPILPAKDGPTTAPGDLSTTGWATRHGLRYNQSTIASIYRTMYSQASQGVNQYRKAGKESKQAHRHLRGFSFNTA